VIFEPNATLDLSNAEYETRVPEIVTEFCQQNKHNTPFIIKTGTDTRVRAFVTMTLDRITYSSKWRDDEIEVLEVC
jgi:GDP-D-mannose dehydratase